MSTRNFGKLSHIILGILRHLELHENQTFGINWQKDDGRSCRDLPSSFCRFIILFVCLLSINSIALRILSYAWESCLFLYYLRHVLSFFSVSFRHCTLLYLFILNIMTYDENLKKRQKEGVLYLFSLIVLVLALNASDRSMSPEKKISRSTCTSDLE